jgi:ATP-dependent Clp protease ATP-binding subunit ClpC
VNLDLTMKSDARQKFEDVLRKSVIGQETAITTVSAAYERILAGMNDATRTLGNLMFLGPTGVGKSLLVETVAEAIHGDRNAITTVNCAEYSEEHQIARLIGAPPGYIGHDTTEPYLRAATLTRGWKDGGPKISVVLFDEIEKASVKLWQLLLGIMGKGEITNGKNQLLGMNRCWVFMASNVGSKVINQEHIGFSSRDEGTQFQTMSDEARGAMKKLFPHEFVGRITDTVVFRNLNDADLNKILDIEVGHVYNRAIKNIMTVAFNGWQNKTTVLTGDDTAPLFTLSLTKKLRKFLLSQRDKYGARDLKNTVDYHITNVLATIIGTKQVTQPGVVTLDRTGDRITASFMPVADLRIIVTDTLPAGVSIQ